MEEKDFYWLIGIMEGEGSFMKGSPSSPNRIKMSVQMTDEDVIARIGVLFGRRYITNPARREGHKISYTVCITDSKAYNLMREMYPHMSKRRKGQIKKALDSYDPKLKEKGWKNRSKLTDEVVFAIVPKLKSRSLRSLARDLGVHQESLKRRLIDLSLYPS
jgi:hypothetical protein